MLTPSLRKIAYFAILALSSTFIFIILTTPKGDRNNRKRNLIILSWNEDSDYFGMNWLSNKSIVNGTGIHSDCVFSHDRSLYDQADALIFNWINVDTKDLPWPETRPDDQIWILFTGESPCYTQVPVLEALSEQINFTSSYRLDDDIPSPFGAFRKLEATSRLNGNRRVESYNKNGKVAWLVSHCYTESKREYYAKRLNESLRVDQFGICNRKEIPICGYNRGNIYDCYHQLKNYTFYLAFENSICKDYGTEKLFFAYEMGVIPVIFGGYDTKLLPENSYVNALEYENPEDLAKYLKTLLTKPKELEKFWGWRRTHGLWLSDNPAMVTVRRVCDHLRGQNTIEKTSRNVLWWWYFENQCLKWDRDTLKFQPATVASYEKSEYDDMVARHAGQIIDDL